LLDAKNCPIIARKIRLGSFPWSEIIVSRSESLLNTPQKPFIDLSDLLNPTKSPALHLKRRNSPGKSCLVAKSGLIPESTAIAIGE
jgi:hypothetical protein